MAEDTNVPAEGETAPPPPANPLKTGAVLVSKFVDKGSTDAARYNPYSLLRTSEELFGDLPKRPDQAWTVPAQKDHRPDDQRCGRQVGAARDVPLFLGLLASPRGRCFGLVAVLFGHRKCLEVGVRCLGECGHGTTSSA